MIYKVLFEKLLIENLVNHRNELSLKLIYFNFSNKRNNTKRLIPHLKLYIRIFSITDIP